MMKLTAALLALVCASSEAFKTIPLKKVPRPTREQKYAYSKAFPKEVGAALAGTDVSALTIHDYQDAQYYGEVSVGTCTSLRIRSLETPHSNTPKQQVPLPKPSRLSMIPDPPTSGFRTRNRSSPERTCTITPNPPPTRPTEPCSRFSTDLDPSPDTTVRTP